jgi:hypothetical protein
MFRIPELMLTVDGELSAPRLFLFVMFCVLIIVCVYSLILEIQGFFKKRRNQILAKIPKVRNHVWYKIKEGSVILTKGVWKVSILLRDKGSYVMYEKVEEE